MSGRRFIPHRTVIAQRRAADNTCFIVLGLTITILFIGSLTRLVWKKISQGHRKQSRHEGQFIMDRFVENQRVPAVS